MERAVTHVDEAFAASYEALSSLAGRAFWDPAAPPSNFSASLPDPLRIKPTGLQPHQAAVYEDFVMFVINASTWLILTFHFNLLGCSSDPTAPLHVVSFRVTHTKAYGLPATNNGKDDDESRPCESLLGWEWTSISDLNFEID
ncbi:hypothetical protein F4604DRAFT_2009492 [Suillus subluteus]|nr:hypothetical protein F4604DRAFT_2009492 [Suillus subluteus]